MQLLSALYGIWTSYAVLYFITTLSTQWGFPALYLIHSPLRSLILRIHPRQSQCSSETGRRSRISIVYIPTEFSALALLIVSPSP